MNLTPEERVDVERIRAEWDRLKPGQTYMGRPDILCLLAILDRIAPAPLPRGLAGYEEG